MNPDGKFGLNAKGNGNIILKRFHSKKNRVYLVRSTNFRGEAKNCVLKVFRNPDNLAQEVGFLEILKRHGVRVPKVLQRGDNYLLTRIYRWRELGRFY